MKYEAGHYVDVLLGLSGRESQRKQVNKFLKETSKLIRISLTSLYWHRLKYYYKMLGIIQKYVSYFGPKIKLNFLSKRY